MLGDLVPTLKGTESSLSYVQCFLNLVSSSVNVSVLHITWLNTIWTDIWIFIYVMWVLGMVALLYRNINKIDNSTF